MSDLPIYDSLAVAEQNGLGNLTAVARILERNLGTVHMWTKRRRTTHFPMHTAVYRAGTKVFNLYDIEQVKQWHKDYVPHTGGAPLGNRNWVPKSDKVLTSKAG